MVVGLNLKLGVGLKYGDFLPVLHGGLPPTTRDLNPLTLVYQVLGPKELPDN